MPVPRSGLILLTPDLKQAPERRPGQASRLPSDRWLFNHVERVGILSAGAVFAGARLGRGQSALLNTLHKIWHSHATQAGRTSTAFRYASTIRLLHQNTRTRLKSFGVAWETRPHARASSYRKTEPGIRPARRTACCSKQVKIWIAIFPCPGSRAPAPGKIAAHP